jgi:uncharacterized protein YegL
MTTIRAFFAPLIQQAMDMKEMSVKQSKSANLIDQMVQATEGAMPYHPLIYQVTDGTPQIPS